MDRKEKRKKGGLYLSFVVRTQDDPKPACAELVLSQLEKKRL